MTVVLGVKSATDEDIKRYVETEADYKRCFTFMRYVLGEQVPKPVIDVTVSDRQVNMVCMLVRRSYGSIPIDEIVLVRLREYERLAAHPDSL